MDKSESSSVQRGTVRISFKPGKKTVIESIDLITDQWRDYVDHLSAAEIAEQKRDLRSRNRSIRAAMGSLLSHWDGIVSDLENRLRENHKWKYENWVLARAGESEVAWSTRCLKKRGADLRDFLWESRRMRLPDLRIRLKALRDITTHPAITKPDPLARRRQLSALDTYDLTVAQVRRDGKSVSRWLDALCRGYSYERLADTKGLCDTFAKAVGGTGEITEC